MGSVETSVFLAIYGLPEWLRPFFGAVTFLGSIWLIVGLVGGLALARHFAVAVRLALAAGGASIASVLLKQIIMRPRPFLALSDVENRDLPTAGFGFPSGHTSVAFAAAFLLIHFTPKAYRPWLVVIAFLVGLSRIYLGVHAPLDVVAGAALGGLAACLTLLVRRIPKKFS